MKTSKKDEPTILGKTAKDLVFYSVKRGYEDGSIIAHQRYIHSVLGATSFAFFLALFSAGAEAKTNIYLNLCEIFFAIGIISNVSLCFHYQAADDRQYLWEIDHTKLMSCFKNIAYLLPTLGVLSLISFFSTPAALSAFAAAIVSYGVFKITPISAIKNSDELSKYKIKLIKNNQWEDLTKLDKFNFTPRTADNGVTTNLYKYKAEDQSGSIIELLSLNHQANPGDTIHLTNKKTYTITHIKHSEGSTSLICEEVIAA